MRVDLEIEVKLRCESADAARDRLAAAGARPTAAREFEDNRVYDRAHDSLREAGRLLRLRVAGGRAVVTFKAPVAGEHRHKVREEHETGVADAGAMDRVLRGLGFRAVYRYQKYRSLYELGEAHVCLDETPLGCFIELEGAPGAIDRAAARLGYEPADYVLDTYRDLHERRARERGVEAGDLVFEDAGAEPRR